ncbi:MAG TPA: sigma-70 family RNA polymerase sigma factor [Vicinamibacteria bacterium]|nr:sigma-70 family RNA polymerase sigma factor [Vicinamibacteria bacterium]
MGPADRAPRDPAGPPAPDETFLLARARQGDLSAFEEVVRRYQRRVYGTALRIVRCHDVADDVSQEAFVRAWRSLDRFDTARPFGPWVCRIAANLALNHVRSPRAREEALPEEQKEARSEAPGPLQALLDEEGRRVLDEAIGELSEEQRAVFVLRAFEELSYAEIAEALGLQPGTVMSRLFRARARLARTLRPYLGLQPSRPRGGVA